ncbi:DUF4124 domain-containing protein [Pseudomonas sp. Marseille-QA0892]
MRRTYAGLALLLITSPVAVAAQVYKWQDANGSLHFSELPPNGVESLRVDTRLAQASGPTTLPLPRLDSQKAEDEQRAIDERVKAEVAEQEANRNMFCTTLRTNLAHLKNNPRVRVQEGGEPRRVTEEERQQHIQDTEKRIADNCS